MRWNWTVIPLSYLVGSLCAQLPLTSSFIRKPLLDKSFDIWLAKVNNTWATKGIGIAVVRRDQSGNWDVETKGYGIRDSSGAPVTEDVG